MSETNNPNPLSVRNRYCAICKYFCRPFSLRHHNRTKHPTTSLQVGGIRFSESRKNKYFGIGPKKSIKNPDEDESTRSSEETDTEEFTKKTDEDDSERSSEENDSDESTKSSVEDDASTDSSERAESTDADDSCRFR